MNPEISPSPSDPLPGRPEKRAPGAWFWIAVLALALALWQWLETRTQLRDLQQEVARRLETADLLARGVRDGQQPLLEQLAALQTAQGSLDERLRQIEGQGAGLEALYRELGRTRDQMLLLEVEQAITLAGQQLQLAGNVPAALLALRSADANLARLDSAQYLNLRKALAADIERLNATPHLDLPGLSLRLEQILLAADKLPLRLSAPLPVTPAAAPVPAEAAQPWWRQLQGQIWQEIRGLVRVQRFDQSEPVLLAPEQAFFLRENLKLRLLNARLALFSQDPWTFRNEIGVAQSWLSRHFLAEDPAVQSAMDSLQKIGATEIRIELPNLQATQQALNALRPARELR